ncbi:hypothetical protein KSP40_PGU019759 [Platanthera guangdongensis]|uniref:Uncharacterized protein n=1 Tax=Platanthera guangdongensis TaxID=2320717 RepID=A0ABR2LIR1_9ASPA
MPSEEQRRRGVVFIHPNKLIEISVAKLTENDAHSCQLAAEEVEKMNGRRSSFHDPPSAVDLLRLAGRLSADLPDLLRSLLQPSDLLCFTCSHRASSAGLVTAVGHAAMLAAIQRYVPSLIPSTYARERIDLLRQLEKVKELEACEGGLEEGMQSLTSSSSNHE